MLNTHDLHERFAAQDIQLAFFDVDGTLLDLDGNYSRRLKKAMIDVRRQGIKTAIASGRPKFAVDFLINDLQIDAAGVYYTGALVFDPQTNTSLIERPLQATQTLHLLDRARELQVYTEVCTRDDFYIEQHSPISAVHAQHLRVAPKFSCLNSIIAAEPIFKLLMAVDELSQPGVLQLLAAEFPHLHFAYACLPSYPSWSFVSVIDSSACKNQAFDRLLMHHGVDAAQVVAFGDADSDKIFLQRAGVGVAMGNAKPEIKQVADVVTDTAANDGVAQVLEVLLHCKK